MCRIPQNLPLPLFGLEVVLIVIPVLGTLSYYVCFVLLLGRFDVPSLILCWILLVKVVGLHVDSRLWNLVDDGGKLDLMLRIIKVFLSGGLSSSVVQSLGGLWLVVVISFTFFTLGNRSRTKELSRRGLEYTWVWIVSLCLRITKVNSPFKLPMIMVWFIVCKSSHF